MSDAMFAPYEPEAVRPSVSGRLDIVLSYIVLSSIRSFRGQTIGAHTVKHKTPLLVCLLAALASIAATAWTAAAGRADGGDALTQIVLVRHAEKADGENPPLTEPGVRRAGLLARMLSEAGVDAIYTTDLERSKQTARPLSKLTGIAPVELSTQTGVTAHAHALAKILKSPKHRGEVVVCVEHSDTIPTILEDLGAEGFDESVEYEHMFILLVGDNVPTQLLVLRYEAVRPCRR